MHFTFTSLSNKKIDRDQNKTQFIYFMLNLIKTRALNKNGNSIRHVTSDNKRFIFQFQIPGSGKIPIGTLELLELLPLISSH